MGGLDFLNGFFLFAAFAALVPLVIHLIQRRRIRQVVFGSVRFLRRRSKQVLRRRRLTELLLILLRCAALGLLALGFARPFFTGGAGGGDARLAGREAVLLLIDDSYSMGVDGRLARAASEATRILDDCPPGTPVAVAAFSSGFRLVSGFDATPEQAREAIRNLQPTFGGTELEAALEQAQRTLLQRKEERRRLVLVSDFQKTAWGESAAFRMDAGTVLQHVDVGGESRPNVTIDRVVVPRLVVAGGEKDVVSAWVANASDTEAANVQVAFYVGDQLIQKQRVNVRPRSAAPVRFRHDFAEAGDIAGRIAAEAGDGLPADDVGWFSVHVTPRVRVLLVSPDGGGGPSDEAFFLARAAVPDPAGAFPFTVRQAAAGRLSAADLADVDVALFADVTELSKPGADAVREFVEAGGGVGFFCGPRMDADRFNATLAPLAPCRLWKLAREADQEPAAVGWVDYQHEVFEPFAGPRSGDFASAPVGQYFLVRDSQGARVLARFNTAHPALLEKRIGRGTSMLFTSTADLRWNQLPVKSVWPALVHQVLKRLCATRESGLRNVAVGDSVSLPLGAAAAGAKLTAPAGSAAELAVRPLPDGGAAAAFTADRPGIYEIDAADAAARFAVNLPAGEADLTHMDVPVWLAQVAAPAGEAVRGPGGATILLAAAGARQRAEQQQRIWLYLMGLAVAALVAEMVLATRSDAAGRERL